jgi:hypothetical protein
MNLAYQHIQSMSAVTERQQQIIETIARVYGEKVPREISFLIAQLMESNEKLLAVVQAINANGTNSEAAINALSRAAGVISKMPGD